MVANNEFASLMDVYATTDDFAAIADVSDPFFALVVEHITSEGSTFSYSDRVKGFLPRRPSFFDVRAVLVFAITMCLGQRTWL